MSNAPLAILAMPHRGTMHVGAAQAFFAQATNGKVNVMAMPHSHSILERNFNTLWCAGLNLRQEHRPRYFAMLHDDVVPEAFWLDKLIAELELYEADVMSAVIPIKNGCGLTSTAVGDPANEWSTELRRITLREAHELPVTFGREDIDWPDSPAALLVNSGCWVCRFDSDWVEKITFRTESRNLLVDGQWEPQCFPEDWAFSVDAHNLGLKVMATRAVALFHERENYPNNVPWGNWSEDAVWRQHEAKAQQPCLTK